MLPGERMKGRVAHVVPLSASIKSIHSWGKWRPRCNGAAITSHDWLGGKPAKVVKLSRR